jgi:hypothetical protein
MNQSHVIDSWIAELGLSGRRVRSAQEPVRRPETTRLEPVRRRETPRLVAVRPGTVSPLAPVTPGRAPGGQAMPCPC